MDESELSLIGAVFVWGASQLSTACPLKTLLNSGACTSSPAVNIFVDAALLQLLASHLVKENLSLGDEREKVLQNLETFSFEH